MSVEAWLATFPRFDGRKGIKLGLERMEALLALLGEPHKNLSFIHVAGTNGKGSTCAFLSSMYREGGYRVGLYVSPQLMHFNDRISINGADIQEEKLERLVERLKPIVQQVTDSEAGQPTEFELVTALALLYFAEEGVDLVIWETGLGGRLDATNVVTPLVSVITNIGFDHMAILGDSIQQIAMEKAGIIKRGIPVVTGAHGESLDVIRSVAQLQSSPITVLHEDFSYTPIQPSDQKNDEISPLVEQVFYWNKSAKLPYSIGMLGAHQLTNAAVALAAVQIVQQQGWWMLDDEQIRRGLSKARWPGRLEVLQQKPLVLLDGAHNQHGAAALDRALVEMFGDFDGTIIYGTLQDKIDERIFGPILQHARKIIITQPKTSRAADAWVLGAAVEHWCTGLRKIPVTIIPSVADAIAFALADERILVTGSLYTVQDARIVWNQGVFTNSNINHCQSIDGTLY